MPFSIRQSNNFRAAGTNEYIDFNSHCLYSVTRVTDRAKCDRVATIDFGERRSLTVKLSWLDA